MRIEPTTDVFGHRVGSDTLVLNAKELGVLRQASAICARAREAAEAHVGPEWVDSEEDYALAQGEHAFAELLEAGGRVDLFT